MLSLSGKPAIVDQIVMAEALFEGLTRKRYEARSSTIYALYQSGFGVTVVGGVERVRAVDCDAFAAEVFGIEPGRPVLRIERIAHTFGAKPAEFRISVINTEHFDYVSNL